MPIKNPNRVTKGYQWLEFANQVSIHIREYAVKQYGDFPDRQVEQFTLEKIQGKLEYYIFRMGRGQRGKAEAIRDMLKIAHLACYGYAILTKGRADK